MMWIRKADWLRLMLVTLPFLLTLAACDGGELATPTPTPTVNYNLEWARDQFAYAKATWEREGSDDYTIEAEASCLCPVSNRPFMITVRDGAIESVRDSTSDEVVTNIYPFQTIDDLFRDIERALRDPPAPYLGAAYHLRLGYPVYFGASFSYAVDDGYSLVISYYRPLEESP